MPYLQVLTLILSDVIGDPLDIIASGPTVRPSAAATAPADIVNKFGLTENELGPSVMQPICSNAESEVSRSKDIFSNVTNLVVGNISVALEAIIHKTAEVWRRE